MEEVYKVSLLRRVWNALVSVLINTLFGSLIYLMFFTENKIWGLIYIVVVSLSMGIRAYVKYYRGVSFMIDESGVTVLDKDNRHYSKDSYYFKPVEHQYRYNFITIQSSKYLEIYDENNVLIDSIDCRTLNHKRFMKLSWSIKDLNDL